MSNQQNDNLVEAKYEQYQDYLIGLDKELLRNEFNDRVGCDPEDYFTNSANINDRDKLIDVILDLYSVVLLDDLEAQWVPLKNTKKLSLFKKFGGA